MKKTITTLGLILLFSTTWAQTIDTSVVQNLVPEEENENYKAYFLYIDNERGGKRSKKIKVDGKKIVLTEGEYYVAETKAGRDYILFNIGGLLGVNARIGLEEENRYFQISPGSVSPGFGRGVGISFNNGRVKEMDEERAKYNMQYMDEFLLEEH